MPGGVIAVTSRERSPSTHNIVYENIKIWYFRRVMKVSLRTYKFEKKNSSY